MSTAASSMPAPASENIGEHFGLSDRTVDTLVTSIFVLGLGFGPFLFAPMHVYTSTLSLSLSLLPQRRAHRYTESLREGRERFANLSSLWPSWCRRSELYGRKSAYTTSTIPFALMNLSCIFAPSCVSTPANLPFSFFKGPRRLKLIALFRLQPCRLSSVLRSFEQHASSDRPEVLRWSVRFEW